MITNRKLYEKADELVHDIFRLTEKVKDLTEQIGYLEKTVHRLYGIQTRTRTEHLEWHNFDISLPKQDAEIYVADDDGDIFRGAFRGDFVWRGNIAYPIGTHHWWALRETPKDNEQ